MFYIIIAIVFALLIYVFIMYNSFIKLSNIVKEAFSTMDVYLEKRWDIIPNLIEIVKGYMEHEKDVISQVTMLRDNIYQEMSTDKKININEQLTGRISTIIAVSENYPDLKANQNFLELTRNLTKIEDEIANSRKYYNGSVRIFNTKIQLFPNNIIANMFGFKEVGMYEADIDKENSIKVEL